MKTYKLNEMHKGWFVGNFFPTAFQFKHAEVGIKTYKKGQYDTSHFHKIGNELTAIISGKVEMMGIKLLPGDIIHIEPGEISNFKALEDTTLVVFKNTSITNDKFLVEKNDKKNK